ncbi:MAG: hypothetical protein K1X75_17800 [Leptospirales bacterium]|nr:hypothetical protein [Leptospirales bacterium]
MRVGWLFAWLLMLSLVAGIVCLFILNPLWGAIALVALLILAILDYRFYASRTNAFAVWAYVATRYMQLSRGSLEKFARNTNRLQKLAGNQPALLPESFPMRSGGRPAMVHGLPHRQLDQLPSAEMREYFRKRFTKMEDIADLKRSTVEFKPSVWELTGAEALIVQNCTAENCNSELMRARGEFAHLHSHDGSLHVVVPIPDLITIIRKEWGDMFAPSGGFWRKIPHVALVYAPRDRAEADIVGRVLRASFQYCTTASKERKA